jgi:hypothetical protein
MSNSSSIDLEGTLNKLLTQQLLKRSVRSQGKLDTSAVLQYLEQKKVLPQYICKKFSNDLVDWISYRHKDVIPHSDRHGGLAWSTQNIHYFAVQNLNKYLQELMQEIQTACEICPPKQESEDDI